MKEIITRTNDGRTETMHRCRECWKQFAFWIDGKLFPAFDNGFVLTSEPIQHAKGCSHEKD